MYLLHIYYTFSLTMKTPVTNDNDDDDNAPLQDDVQQHTRDCGTQETLLQTQAARPPPQMRNHEIY
jgi:hypothetical protein